MNRKAISYLCAFLAIAACAVRAEAVAVPPPPPGGFGPGDTLWTRVYDGPAQDMDYAVTMVVDATGNAYVTGYGPGLGTGNDIATIKYGPDGTVAWVQRYNGAADMEDKPSAITVDAAGNVYVVGYSGFAPLYDYVTIKYNSAGVQQWVDRYDGVGLNQDVATGVAVDDSGNVYVTGYSYDNTAQNADYVTLKYDADGNQRYLARYDGPGEADDMPAAIVVDAHRNAYVTGASGGADRYYTQHATTIKYDTIGVESWKATYVGFDTTSDLGRAIVLAPGGAVYVAIDGSTNKRGQAGKSVAVTVKYTPDSVQAWSARYTTGTSNDPTAIALDQFENARVLVREGVNRILKILVLNYAAANGAQSWACTYDGPVHGMSAPGHSIVVDARGYSYVNGYTRGTDSTNALATLRITPTGAKDWEGRYSTQTDNVGVALGLDGQRNIYSLGTTFSNGSYNFVTVKYESLPSGIAEAPNNERYLTPGVAVAPNPVRGNARVTYVMPRAAVASLRLYDATGSLVGTLATGHTAAGAHTATINAAGLVPGIYLLRFETESYNSTQKIVVQ